MLSGSRTQVLIVGAGPTGLTLAIELARRDIDFRIVDRLPQRAEISKALVIQPRTLELLSMQGIVGRFLARGYPAPGLNIGLGAVRPVSIDLRHLDTDYPFLLVLPQGETEQLLEKHLIARGHSIERSVTFESLDTTGGPRVRVTLRHSSEDVEQLEADYVVACDGTHSAVREAAEMPFEGSSFDEVVFLADVKLDTDFVRSRITNFTADRGFVSVLPFMGEYSRIFAVDHTKQGPGPHDPLELADLEETVNAIVPFHMRLTDPRWITRFKSPSKMVAKMRKGRVLFAGDAAHSHSPAGGQGMNSGMQDAFNLGWKLASQIKGTAPPDLLDSYDEERRPVNGAVQKATDRMFESFLLRNRAARLLRDAALTTIVPIPAVGRKLALDLSGIGAGYRTTLLDTEAKHSGRREVRPGDRVPDLSFWAPDRPIASLFERLESGAHQLFCYLSIDRFADDGAFASRLLAMIQKTHGKTVECAIVLDEGAEKLDDGVEVLLDTEGHFRDRLGARHGSAILVRPDGHLGAHRSRFRAQEALSAWTVPSR